MTYSSNASTTTAVTVAPSFAARSCAAVHKASGTRTDRIVVPLLGTDDPHGRNLHVGVQVVARQVGQVEPNHRDPCERQVLGVVDVDDVTSVAAFLVAGGPGGVGAADLDLHGPSSGCNYTLEGVPTPVKHVRRLLSVTARGPITTPRNDPEGSHNWSYNPLPGNEG